MHPGRIAVYLRGMMPTNERRPERGPLKPVDLLEFRPWMLALAVFLACAIGIAIMEQVRQEPVWAQVTPQETAHPAP